VCALCYNLDATLAIPTWQIHEAPDEVGNELRQRAVGLPRRRRAREQGKSLAATVG
jgi:hypothetical protein